MSKVLVIDDDTLVRETLLPFLEDLDYETCEAVDGIEGLEQFALHHPDIILVDLRMPRMDGLEFITRLREISPDTPLIVVSGNGMLDEAVKAIRLGAWDYISKPIFSGEVLSHALDKALDRKRLLEENRAYARHLEETNRRLTQSNEDLNRSLRQLHEDEEAGKRIQFSLLPKSHTRFGRYELSHVILPSARVSGDFVDYFEINPGYFGFYIADVAGHGVSSAFVTVLLKSFFSRQQEKYRHGLSLLENPGQLLQLLNSELLSEKLEKFVTIFYGLVNTATDTLYFANGGQFPFPVLVTKESCEFIKMQSMVVGMIEAASYETHSLILPPECDLVFMSDGIMDLLPDLSLTWKQDHILELCGGLHTELDELQTKFEIKTGADNLPDDVTFLLVRRRNQ